MPVFEFDGLNRLRSNLSAHSSTPDRSGRFPFTDFVDLITDGAHRIRKRRGAGVALGTLPAAVVAIHEFERVNPTTGVATLYQFAATAAAIYRWNGAGFNAAETMPPTFTVSAGSAWQFLNFENRCFAVNGKDAMIVFDGTSWRIVGIDPPAAAPTYSLGGVVSLGVVAINNGSTILTVSGVALTSLTSVGTTATATTATAHNLPANAAVTITGASVAAYNGTYTITVVTPYIFTYTFAGGAATTGALAYANWTTGGSWNDLYSDINGTRYQINTIDSASTATLKEQFKEANATGVSYRIYTGVMDWANPPKYGAVYYNPTTGHSSNLSPTLQLTEKDQLGVTPTITLAAAQQNQDAYQAGYTEIKMFRSFKNGNVMVAINQTIANVNSNSAAITYVETATTGKDTALTNFIAPQDTNKKPPTALTAIAAWLGRIFALRPSDPTNTPADAPRVYFCATRDEVQFGVAEECWPRRYSRWGVPQPKGLLALGGDTLANGILILSSDGDWTLEGYDNLTFTPPHRIGARRSGGFQGGAVDVSGTLVQLYRDKRLLSGTDDIGEPIQDKLNGLAAQYLTGARVHWFAYENDTYLLVTAPKTGSTVNNYGLIFDYDRERFYEWALGWSAAGNVHSSTGALELWVGDTTGAVYRMLQAAAWRDGGVDYAPYCRTAPLRFPVQHQLRRVHLFVGPAGAQAQTWQLNYRVDGEATGTTVTFQAGTTGRESAQGYELIYECEANPVGQTFDVKIIFPTANTDMYIEKMLVVIDEVQEETPSP